MLRLKPRYPTLGQMERMVLHNAMRKFPHVSQSDFRIGAKTVRVIAKFVIPSRVIYTYFVDGKPVTATVARQVILGATDDRVPHHLSR